MSRPVIGLAPLADYGRRSLWMLPGYMEGVMEAGGLPVMLPLTSDREAIDQLARGLDGVLLTGGQDVAPELYGEAKLSVCGETSPERDEMEARLLDAALELDLPVLGICRGIQFLNAHLGGTLWQDLPAQHPSEVCHRQKPPYDQPSHPVEVYRGTPLYDLLTTEGLMVNSCHHQAVRDLSPELAPMAASPDGLVEAAYLPGKSFVWGVQWHPEFSHRSDANSRRIFWAFVSACRGK